jgi:signal transduction histidine kinase
MKDNSQERRHQNINPSGRIQDLENEGDFLLDRIKQLEIENHKLHIRLSSIQRETLMVRILDILPVGVWLTDQNGKIIQVNLAAQLIWSGAKMVNVEEDHEFKGWCLGSGAPLTADDWPMIRAVRYGETRLNEEFEIESFDGTRKIVSNSAIPIFSGTQEIGGAIVVFEDITHRKQMEKILKDTNQELELRVSERTSALQRSNQDLEDFAFVASHDLQEPLRKVLMFGKLLKDSSTTHLTHDELDYIERMNSAAKRMSQMLSALLEYSRLNTQAQPPKQVNLQHVVAEVLVDLDLILLRTKGTVEVDSLPTIEAEPIQMRQLMQNLIGNGLKFHKKNTAPVVKIYQVENDKALTENCQLDGMVTIVIEDQGIGFNPEHKDRMFQPFTRLVGRSEYEGTGIGLSICRKIVDRHGGKIEVYSKLGEGAKFVIMLPIKQESKQNT